MATFQSVYLKIILIFYKGPLGILPALFLFPLSLFFYVYTFYA